MCRTIVKVVGHCHSLGVMHRWLPALSPHTLRPRLTPATMCVGTSQPMENPKALYYVTWLYISVYISWNVEHCMLALSSCSVCPCVCLSVLMHHTDGPPTQAPNPVSVLLRDWATPQLVRWRTSPRALLPPRGVPGGCWPSGLSLRLRFL